MPLVVGSKILTDIPGDIWQFVDSYPSLKESTEKLRRIDSKSIGSRGLLYVCQREYAVVSPSDANIDIIGSDDATTCHILVMKHSGGGVAGIAHLDGCGTEQSIKQMFHKLKKLSTGMPEGRFEAHLVGGFMDDRGLSRNISQEILGSLIRLPDPVHLLTACITDYNDIVRGSTHFPIIYGIAYELKTGALYPAVFTEDKGPDIDIRQASHFTNSEQLVDIYDNGQLIVGPFEWQEPIRNITHYLKRPDEYFLKYWSTSPEQEPVHFVDQLRRALCILRDHPNPTVTLFPGNRPRLYRKQSSGQWSRSN